MALPHGALGWSAVCDCGMFLIILTFVLAKMPLKWMGINVQDLSLVLSIDENLNELCVPVLIAEKYI